MCNPRVGRRRVELRLVGNARALVLGHPIVDFEDHALSAIVTGLGDLAFPDDRECIEDVVCILPRDVVKVEVESVKLAANEKATALTPDESVTMMTNAASEWRDVGGC